MTSEHSSKKGVSVPKQVERFLGSRNSLVTLGLTSLSLCVKLTSTDWLQEMLPSTPGTMLSSGDALAKYGVCILWAGHVQKPASFP